MGSYIDRLALTVRRLGDYSISIPANVAALIMFDRANLDRVARRTLIQIAGLPMES